MDQTRNAHDGMFLHYMMRKSMMDGTYLEGLEAAVELERGVIALSIAAVDGRGLHVQIAGSARLVRRRRRGAAIVPGQGGIRVLGRQGPLRCRR